MFTLFIILLGMSICAAVGLTIAALYIVLTEACDNPRLFVIAWIVICLVLGIFYAVGRAGAVWLL